MWLSRSITAGSASTHPTRRPVAIVFENVPTRSIPSPPATSNSEVGGSRRGRCPCRRRLRRQSTRWRGELGQLFAARERERGAAGVVVVRDHVDQLHRSPSGALVLQGGSKSRHLVAVVVLRHVDDAGAASAEGADRAGVGGGAGHDHVAGAEEGSGDVIDRVRTAGSERDVFRGQRRPVSALCRSVNPRPQRRVSGRAAICEGAARVGGQGAPGRLRQFQPRQAVAVGHAGVRSYGSGDSEVGGAPARPPPVRAGRRRRPRAMVESGSRSRSQAAYGGRHGRQARPAPRLASTGPRTPPMLPSHSGAACWPPSRDFATIRAFAPPIADARRDG